MDARGLGEGRNLLEILRGVERLVPVRDEALAREADGRRDHVGERHGAEAFQRERQARD